jgi:hypothetical protein
MSRPDVKWNILSASSPKATTGTANAENTAVKTVVPPTSPEPENNTWFSFSSVLLTTLILALLFGLWLRLRGVGEKNPPMSDGFDPECEAELPPLARNRLRDRSLDGIHRPPPRGGKRLRPYGESPGKSNFDSSRRLPPIPPVPPPPPSRHKPNE